MSEEIITKEKAKELIEKSPMETRGFNVKHDGEYILKEKGNEGLAELEKVWEEIGYPIKYKEIKDMDFIPGGMRAVSLLAIKKAFQADDEEIRNVCYFHPRTSLIVRLSSRYIYSLPSVMKKAQNMWKTYWTEGELEFAEHNKEEKYIIMRIKDFNLHPLFCRCMEGYFASIAKLVLKEKTRCRETKCGHQGDDYHEFLIEW
ncbi:MAG: hypothetical protein GF370_00650 [Candidatus Nealsonbacteria bacterium]|nr:hypothetical protein [Candidatus Nealsonbacteria bacterium]